MDSAPKSVMANSGYSNNKVASKPQVSGASSFAMPARNYTPLISQDFEGSISVSKGYGHLKSQCPK